MQPGPEGFAQFQRQLQRITGMPMLEAMQITFQCKAPESGAALGSWGVTRLVPGHGPAIVSMSVHGAAMVSVSPHPHELNRPYINMLA